MDNLHFCPSGGSKVKLTIEAKDQSNFKGINKANKLNCKRKYKNKKNSMQKKKKKRKNKVMRSSKLMKI